jgi:glutamyl-tRNA synthetase
MTVVTRFAPSPTGFLHIGGARTALFNWLLARHHGGSYHLRIEDTDRERSTQAAIDAILEGLDWLGLSPDGPVVYQYARAPRHRECAHAMVEAGTAYRCYVSQAELAARREEGERLREAVRTDTALNEAEREAMRARAAELLAPFRSPWREGGRPPSPDAPYTVRLRAPDTGRMSVADHVQGEVAIDAAEIDDLVLLRADGDPTYMLAVVVDDHDMGVTHVLRGDDHFRNTFRQIPIYQANGWHVPEFAHVPLIHGADGAKLSKRHGALGIDAYREMGFLPEALCNYLLRLGWSHGDTELVDMEEAARLFTLQGLNRAPSRLDFDKLGSVNAHYLRACDAQRLFDLTVQERRRHGPVDERQMQIIRAALPTMKERAQTVVALAQSLSFMLAPRPIAMSAGALKQLDERASAVLGALLPRLSELARDETAWNAEAIKGALQAHASAQGVGFGQVGGPLRAALTGGEPAPDIAQLAQWLGPEETAGRITDALDARPAEVASTPSARQGT